MSAVAASSAPVRRTRWEWISLALIMCAMFALLWLGGLTLTTAINGDLDFDGIGLGGLALAATLYLASHGLRILRLALLIGGWRIGFRTVVAFHLMTASVALLAPLKVGELYRVVELGNLVGNFTRGVIIAWWERAFDVAVLLILIAAALANTPPETHGMFYGVAAIAGVFVIGTVLAFFVAPENLRRVSVLIIRRYEHGWTVPVLRAIDAVRRAIRQAPALIDKKLASLLTLTILIWTLEILCFAIMIPAFSATVGLAAEGLLGFLSSVTRGETILTSLDASHSELRNYLAATQAPLVLLGSIACAAYAFLRFGAPRGRA
jgi:hypothetical protein